MYPIVRTPPPSVNPVWIRTEYRSKERPVWIRTEIRETRDQVIIIRHMRLGKKRLRKVEMISIDSECRSLLP